MPITVITDFLDPVRLVQEPPPSPQTIRDEIKRRGINTTCIYAYDRDWLPYFGQLVYVRHNNDWTIYNPPWNTLLVIPSDTTEWFISERLPGLHHTRHFITVSSTIK